MSQADGLQHPDDIPADVGLIPTQAKTGGTGVGVMILVPILAPGAQLERPKPPKVDAGIALFGFPQMREAVHKALHVKRIEQANGTHPEKAHPAETENQTTENGKKNDGSFCPAPDLVNPAREFRRPSLLVGGLGLVQP